MRFIDPDGMFLKPTPKEAAAIADNVYNASGNDGLIGGWKRSSAESNINYNDSNTSLNSALYERTKEDGTTEYVYATAGTHGFKDLAADALQLVGLSGQYAESVSNAKEISSDLQGKELTFVGHSLGGGEAAANSMATGRDAITFNAAGLSDATRTNLGIGFYNIQGHIDNFDVKGQLIGAQTVLGIHPAGENHALKTATTPLQTLLFGSATTGLLNHLMSAVKKSLGN